MEVVADHDYIAISFDPPRPWPLSWQRNRMRGELRLDLIPYRRCEQLGKPVLTRATPKGGMQATGDGGYAVCADMVLPLSQRLFLGTQLPVPHKPEAYLQSIYGDFSKVEFTYMDQAAVHNRTPSS